MPVRVKHKRDVDGADAVAISTSRTAKKTYTLPISPGKETMNLSTQNPLANDVLPVLGMRGRTVGDILALITAGDAWGSPAIVAAHLATRFGTSLTGAYFDPEINTTGMGDVSMSPFAQPLASIANAFESPNGREFAAFARRLNAVDTHWTTLRTQIARRLHWLGSWHDLVVLESNMANVEKVRSILSNLLITCHLPCLVLPPNYHDSARFERIAIGWNSSLSATRAIHAARPLLAQARQVYLLDGTLRSTDQRDDFPHFDPYQYLAQDGITVVPIEVADDASGASLLSSARHVGSDLFVLGAYSHSPMRERILGGVTRYALEHADIPLFTRH